MGQSTVFLCPVNKKVFRHMKIMLIHRGALRISSVCEGRSHIFSYLKFAKMYLKTAEMKKLVMRFRECAKKLGADFGA